MKPKTGSPRCMWYLLLPIIFAICTGLAGAAEEALPSGEAVMDRYIEATGGLDAYGKIYNSVFRGAFEIEQAGIKADLTIYQAMPNKIYTRLESDATGTIESGSNGGVFWERSVMTGPKLKEGQEKEDAIRDAVFNKFARWREIYQKAACVGAESVDGAPCHKVILTPKSGSSQTLYFNKASGLLVKAKSVVEHQMGNIPVEASIGDYREVDGILVSHKAKVSVMGQTRMVTAESIEHNVDIPEDRFSLPEEIQELVDKAKEE